MDTLCFTYKMIIKKKQFYFLYVDKSNIFRTLAFLFVFFYLVFYD